MIFIIFHFLDSLSGDVKFFIFIGAVACIYYFLSPILKHSKKRFWKTIIFFSPPIFTYYILKRFFLSFYTPIFKSIYFERINYLIWKPFLEIVCPVSIGILLFSILIKIIFLIKRKKGEKIKHGPLFTSTKIKKGINVGLFNHKVLPKHIQQFGKHPSTPIIMPYNKLSRGITILGDMGSGKSRLMQAIHNDIREKYPNIPILIHDPKGEWLRTYYNPATDLIFAPFDERSCSWSLWEDFKNKPELKHTIISSAIENHHSGTTSDRFWYDSAISLLKDASSEKSLQKAKDFLKMQKDLHPDDRTFQSVLYTALLSFRDIVAVELSKKNQVLTINDFLTFPGRIFLLNNPCCSAEQHGALTLLLSAFFLQAISLPDVSDENEIRAAIFLDEALTFHLPPAVEKAVFSQSRSKGLSIIASAQRLPDKNFGDRGEWSRMATNFFAMRISDLETRNSLAQRLGQMTYNEKKESVTLGKKSTSKTTSEIQRKHPVLAPEDFGKLKDREFILFHEKGIAPGKVIEVLNQQQNIQPIKYIERKDIVEFLRDF